MSRLTQNKNKMENNIQFSKKTSLWISLFASAFIITSCSNNSTDDSKAIAEKQNEQKFNTKSNEKDAQFLVNVAEMNMAEISFSELAILKSKTDQVKQLAKTTEIAHNKLLIELKDLAKNKMITLPTLASNKSQENYKELNNQPSNEFNNEYVEDVIESHQNAIKEFEKAANETTDSDIKSWANATLPLLRTHLDQAVNCQKDLKLMQKIDDRQ